MGPAVCIRGHWGGYGGGWSPVSWAQSNLTGQRLEEAICPNLNHEALFSLNGSQPRGENLAQVQSHTQTQWVVPTSIRELLRKSGEKYPLGEENTREVQSVVCPRVPKSYVHLS